MWNFAKVHWQLYSLLVMLTSRGKLCITWRKWSTDIADSCSNREREHECLPWTDWQELLPHLQSSPILVPHNSETTRNEIFSFFNLCFLCLKSDVKIPLQQNFVKPNLCRHHDQKFRKLYCSVSIFIKLDKNIISNFWHFCYWIESHLVNKIQQLVLCWIFSQLLHDCTKLYNTEPAWEAWRCENFLICQYGTCLLGLCWVLLGLIG